MMPVNTWESDYKQQQRTQAVTSFTLEAILSQAENAIIWSAYVNALVYQCEYKTILLTMAEAYDGHVLAKSKIW